ncbi:unnamed protein product [Spirodela intermedia]|uniref:Uncharacterized protein n=1 Tax=Spirodela intermedia TaxID=51605 RepID=A0A7I8IZJ0_SPIIN|nr:unnamed protein product [Spirodela intermedia]CAA6663298.1 unnamed protein product [Spirodela intermedia]
MGGEGGRQSAGPARQRLSPDGEELDEGGACIRESFILRSTQQDEALHRIYF